jgi:hypothetical protein
MRKENFSVMALFGGVKDYNSIVAPLKKIEGDLQTYIGEQQNLRGNLEKEKIEIDKKISVADLEKKKSEHTARKISELLATDFDGDGTADFVEPPPPDSSE